MSIVPRLTTPTEAPRSWTCPYCPFTTTDVDQALAHAADHEQGRAIALTDAQLVKALDEATAEPDEDIRHTLYVALVRMGIMPEAGAR